MVQSWGITKFLTLVSAFVSVSQADSIIEKASFGLNGRISADKHLIPGWQLSGTGHTPHKLSDRIILTPPYTGNKRGSLWSEQPFDKAEWTVDFEFRSNGADRGGGNLQLWYVKDGPSTVSTSSIYTVGKFDGFALVLDVQGGRGGSIRGFLNDGTTDYKTTNVDSLAFGHCDYAYRNLGRLSHIQIQQTRSRFKVLVDGRECFATEKVFVPLGNTFGITAASAENPDSFEVFKFALSIPDATAPGEQGYQHRPYENQQFPNRNAQNANPNQQRAPNVDNSAIDQRLNDLQSRLNALVGTTERLLTEMHSLSSKVDERHQDTLKKLAPSRDQAGQIEQRMQRIENMIQAVQKDVKNSELKKQLNKLQDSLKNSHSGVIEQLQSTSHQILSSTPRMGFFIFLIVAFQLALAASYIMYKRRRANMPKKFL
ncbi:lectin family integral membrane protein [Blastomyces gilchristii SLH14081]|uniref:Lectin family integral membrane protein n=1 Tax=Blastomyces gilchristii (strain SLH14081) TaxID=559298 RepID=A0A179UFK8_BLAGS|nr:lectin family integral membrane protein [Blastomyces gilchristii SLH14081]OAT06620.1 lectin family integral membrane protein [Blastomyces gilchristii SLH14081]